jgi:hypothetical protein
MTESGSSPSFELGLRIMEGLPTTHPLIDSRLQKAMRPRLKSQPLFVSRIPIYE